MKIEDKDLSSMRSANTAMMVYTRISHLCAYTYIHTWCNKVTYLMELHEIVHGPA